MSRRNTPPTLDVSWDPNPPKKEKATGKYSTTLHIDVGGDWPAGGIPQTVGLTVFTEGHRVDEMSKPVDILNRHGEFPLTGLDIGRDYSIHVDAGSKQKSCLLSMREPEKESSADKELKKALASNKVRADIAETSARIAEANKRNTDATPKHAPVKLTVSDGRLGDDKYKLVIAVRDEHGHGVTHHPLVIKDGQATVTPPRITNGQGIVEYETLTFNDTKPRWIEVIAGVGHDLNWGAQFRKPSNFTKRP